jgi:DNA-binding beta-propeller fold protein YncE
MTTTLLLHLLWIPLWFQNANPFPSEKQASELRAIIQQTPRFQFERTELKAVSAPENWATTMVSWVARDRDGLVYLLQRDAKLDHVIVLDRDRKVVRSWGKGMYTMPHAIRVDPQGNVWTTDAASSMVYKFSKEGKKLMEIAIGGQPTPCRNNFCSTTDIAFAPNGNLFIADGYANARILEYTPDGKKLREWGAAGDGPGQFRLPHSIQVDENGIVFVADRENARVQRFDLQGKYIGEWSKYGKTYSMRLAPGVIWLATQMRLDPNGNTGWLMKVDRQSGKLLGYIEVAGGVHGVEALPNGEVLLASPSATNSPGWYK